jgi:4-amino-4-deoxy-L-arabinose transferase-like glycosyltransferase
MEYSASRYQLIVLVAAAVVFLGCIISPPSLMDDVDAVQAQIARTMLDSGDWVTARLDGVPYLEKSPLVYWMIGTSFRVFGVHDWAARLPIALCTVLLCWVTARFAAWAFGERAGLYTGLVMSTSIGLFLFTRILIPDVILTLTITLTLWGALRALDESERRPRLWAAIAAASMGTGLLLKGLIAAVFPIGGLLAFLAITRQLWDWKALCRLRPFSGALIALAIAAPWHVLATLRNPPYFDFTMHAGPGEYRGFFWFYFFNEHILRFLNLRYPRDYNTVPRLWFWLFHLLWFFPWSVYFPAATRLSYKPADRAGRTRLLALCWAGFLLLFFTFSTTQEYYSMPCYPALALLLGSAMATEKRIFVFAPKLIGALCGFLTVVVFAILWQVRNLPAPGDISAALTQNPDLYTLSLGHMTDLTLKSFAYLRTPLLMAGIALAIGTAACLLWKGHRAILGMTLMMIIFFHAARVAMVTFDPYLGSRPLAEALKQSPPGTVVFDNQYYAFSSVFFYANTSGLLLNGRVNNLEYGSYAPGSPSVFIDDSEFVRTWKSLGRCYLLVEGPSVGRIERLVERDRLHVVKESGGKFLYANFAAPTR